MAALDVCFEREISVLQDRMLEMATCADHMVALSVEALITGNLSLVKEVIKRDDYVDGLDLEIEKQCLNLISTSHLRDRDLRVIGTALKVSTDIERIGDYAVDIAKIGRRIVKAQDIYRPLVDIPRLTQLSRAMLHDALRAFIDHDLAIVERVINADDAVDKLYHQMRNSLTLTLTQEPSKSLVALNVMFAAKYLERISDHVVNIAERVSFIETGQLRHMEMTDALQKDADV